MVCFIASVVLTFIGIFVYISVCGKKDNNIEEDSDYRDVGGIVQNDDKKEDEGKNNDGKKINEEEE